MRKGPRSPRPGLWTPTRAGKLTPELIKRALVVGQRTEESKSDTTLGMRISLSVNGRIFLLTLARMRLEPDEDWDDDLRARINSASAGKRGRALFCVDEELRQKMAAIAFSLKLGKRKPLLAYAIAARREAALADASLALTSMTKLCLHYIGLALERPGELYYDVPRGEERFAGGLGFQNAPAEPKAQAGGTLMRQAAL